jgi:mannose-6-phosphate isomerase-like protein (cupin superfamily)
MEIVRFGVGHRRPEGPRGSRNVSGQVIVSGPGGGISELAFGRNAAIEPHADPRATWFVVIEGGGYVRVGDEQGRVAAGEAVLLPPQVPHAAWTDQGHMRAILVELGGHDPAPALIVEGVSREADAARPAATRSEGRLVQGSRPRYDPQEGEPR